MLIRKVTVLSLAMPGSDNILGIDKIELKHDFMLIDKKKCFHRASYSHFLKARQGIMTWVKLECLYQENFIKPVVG